MERRLAAIVSADVVDYSSLMREDEVGILAALKSIRNNLIQPKTRQYRGRSIKLMGDGELLEFHSIVDALNFSIEIQTAMEEHQLAGKRPVQFRLGINIGDVIVDGDDIYGDGVNLASRIEPLAEPGGITLSDLARDQITNQVNIGFKSLGSKKLKGFDDPIEIFSVILDERAKKLRTDVGGFDFQEPKLPFHKKSFFKIAASLTAVYFAVGGIQYASQGNLVSKNSVFCPFVKLGTPDDAVIKIGAIMPFNEGFGLRQKWGIERAFRDRADVGEYPVQRIIRDSKGNIEEVKNILKEFEDLEVAAVLGPMQSRLAYDAKKWGNLNQVPVVTSAASASYLTGKNVKDYFFRVGMSDSGRANAMIEWLRVKGKHNNPYIIHEWKAPDPGLDEPDIYGASQAAAVKLGINDATTLRFTRGDKASQDEALAQVENNDRAILMFGYTSNLKRMIGELQNRGIKNDIFLMGVVTTALEEANYPHPEKIHVVTGLVSEAKNIATTTKLRRIFEDENPDIDFDLSAYYAYDSVNMVLDALKKVRQESCSGSAAGPAIAEALRQTPTKKRQIINTGFLDDYQDILFEFDGLRIVDGKFVHVGLGK